MPNNCIGCVMLVGTFCQVLNIDVDPFYDGSVKRNDNCPLIELPEKHGRLIDMDELKADYGMKDDCADCEKEVRGKIWHCEFDHCYTKMDFCGWLDDATVIIEAEGVEE